MSESSIIKDRKIESLGVGLICVKCISFFYSSGGDTEDALVAVETVIRQEDVLAVGLNSRELPKVW